MAAENAPASQPVPGELSLEELERRATEISQRRLDENRSKLDREIPELARLWMALAPGWTVELAIACAYPLMPDSDHRDLFERMLSAGLVERYQADPTASETQAYYVMTAPSRAETLQTYLVQGPLIKTRANIRSTIRPDSNLFRRITGQTTAPTDPRGAAYMIEVLSIIGPRAWKACLGLPGAPREFRLWAELAAAIPGDYQLLLTPDMNDDSGAGRVFDRLVESEFSTALKDHEVPLHVGAMQEWIETARPLAVLLEYANLPRLSRSIAKAGRRIELLQRRQYEGRHLTSFYRRAQQIQVVKEFLSGPRELWALNLIGAGGVGKTMLIRYLICSLSVFRGEECLEEDFAGLPQLITARIDFDYLNPQYPSLDPGLLLWSLAQELRLVDVNLLASPYFDQADRKFDQLRQKLKSGRDPNLPNLPWSSAHPLFIEGIELFLEGLRMLNRPVLLILDTCEELEKNSPEEAPLKHVAETFRILRALHDGTHVLSEPGEEMRTGTTNGYQDLRVILSGRRLLARSGGFQLETPEWESLDAQDSTRPESLLPVRPYLRLFELHGFSLAEAGDFIRQEGVPGHLIPAVLIASGPGARSEVQITYNDPGWAPSTQENRCNPYKLRMFIDWAKEEENPPTPGELLNASKEKYFELRIIARLKDETLRETLPLVALLGHFDKQLLAAASGLDLETAGKAYNLLVTQEWTSQHRVASEKDEPRLILDVQQVIRDGLYSYYAQRGDLPVIERQRAAEYLIAWTLNSEPGLIDWTDYDVALRVLQADLEEGAAWWVQVEARLLSAPNLQGSLDQVMLLGGADGSAAQRPLDAPAEIPAQNRLRPFVLATQASLQRKLRQASGLVVTWDEVLAITSSDIDAPGYARLHLRALAGSLIEQGVSGADLRENLIQQFWQELAGRLDQGFTSQDASAWIGAVEAVIESAERASLDQASHIDYIQGSPEGKAGLAQMLAGALFAAWVAPEAFVASTKPVPSSDLGLAAYACALAGRAALLARQVEDAIDYFEKAIQLVERLEMSPRGEILPEILDWLPPADLPSRIRLLYIQAAYPAWLSADDALAFLPPEINRDPNLVEKDRLSAARLRIQLAAGAQQTPGMTRSSTVLQPDEMQPTGDQAASIQPPGVQPTGIQPSGISPSGISPSGIDPSGIGPAGFHPGTCSAHRRELPYHLRRAFLLEAQGEVTAALQTLQAEISAASNNLPALALAQQALLPFLNTTRLIDEGYQAQLNSPVLSIYEYDLQWRLYQALTSAFQPGAQNASPDPLANLKYPGPGAEMVIHLLWIGLVAWKPEQIDRALSFADEMLARQLITSTAILNSGDFWDFSLGLDLCEAFFLEGGSKRQAITTAYSLLQSQLLDPLEWSRQHQYEPEAALRLLLRCQALPLSITGGRSDEIQSESVRLAGHIGLRRAGEIALQEAQLLMLRHPWMALTLFHWATERFAKTGAHFDAWRASILRLMLLLYFWRQKLDPGEDPNPGYTLLTKDEEIQPALQQCESLYRQLANQPMSWEALASLAASFDPAPLDELPVGWRPWIVRQLVCISETLSTSSDPLQTWLANKNYLQRADPPRASLEWSAWFEGASLPMQDQLSSQEGERQGCGGLLAGYWKLLGSAAGILIGLFWPWFFLFRWLVDAYLTPWLASSFDIKTSANYSGLDIMSQVLIAAAAGLGLLTLIYLLIRIFPGIGTAWKRFWLSRGYLTCSISPGAAAGGPPVSPQPEIDTTELPIPPSPPTATSGLPVPQPPSQPFSKDTVLTLRVWTPRLRLKTRPLIHLVELKILAGSILIDPKAPYAAQAGLLPPEIASELGRINTLLGRKRKIHLDLNVATVLGDIAWEAVFTGARADKNPVVESINIQRVKGLGAAPRRFDMLSVSHGKEAFEIATVTASLRAGEIARQAWNGLPGSPGVRWQQISPGLSSNAAIIHLFGSVEENFGALFWTERQEQISYGTQIEPSPESYAYDLAKEEINPTQGSNSFTSTDLLLRFNRVKMAILQGSPVELKPERMDSERRAAGLVRRFAVELQTSGILVITLPPLEPVQTARVLTELAAVVPELANSGPAALHKAINKIRQYLMDLSNPAASPVAGWERAMDVALFLPSDPNVKQEIAK